MIFSEDGTKQDPEKVEALKYISPSTNKEELISFQCMMQSNSDFISNFTKKSAPSGEMTKGEHISDGKINNNNSSKNWLRNSGRIL